MPKLFISYRRKDSAPTAGRLYDRLRGEFGKEAIFMDIDTIGAGSDFADAIEQGVKRADVLLAVIGDKWLPEDKPAEELPLNNADDYVRKEITAAMAHGKLVVPILVDDARMPAQASLPEEIKALGQCHALKLSNTHFDSDYERLIARLIEAMDSAKVPGARLRVCAACQSRVPQSAVKCPKCGHYRRDVERLRALSLGFTGLGIALVFLNALYSDLPGPGPLVYSFVAIILCLIGLGFSIGLRMVSGRWW